MHNVRTTAQPLSSRQSVVSANAVSFSIAGAMSYSGMSRTRLYELIGKGALQARKSGRRTLITGESLRDYIASLPAATIRAPRKAGA